MRHILIIDRDSTTLNDISRLVTALNFEPVVLFNLNSQNNIIRDEIAVIFMDIETKISSPKDVINFFNSAGKVKNGRRIPIVFMYSNAESKLVKEARELPHEAELKKPFTLEKLFELLEKQLDLGSIEYEQFTNEYRLKEMKNYAETMESWLEKFGSILES